MNIFKKFFKRQEENLPKVKETSLSEEILKEVVQKYAPPNPQVLLEEYMDQQCSSYTHKDIYTHHYHPMTRQADHIKIPYAYDIMGVQDMQPPTGPIFTMEKKETVTWTEEEVEKVLDIKSQAKFVHDSFLEYCDKHGVPRSLLGDSILTGGVFICLMHVGMSIDAMKQNTDEKKFDIDFFVPCDTMHSRNDLISALMKSNGFKLTTVNEYSGQIGTNNSGKINSCWQSTKKNVHWLDKDPLDYIPYNVILSNFQTRDEIIKDFDLVHTQAAYQNDKLWISKKTYYACRDKRLVFVDPTRKPTQKRIDRLKTRGMTLGT